MEEQYGYSLLASEKAVVDRHRGHDDDDDDAKLRLLGYEPQLNRNLSLLSNFAVTFSIVSVLTGVSTTFATGLRFGGPVTMVYGWPIAGAFTLVVGLAMAEICSAYPTSGGLYFWSAKLCRDRWGPFASWVTGWERGWRQIIFRRNRDGSHVVLETLCGDEDDIGLPVTKSSQRSPRNLTRIPVRIGDPAGTGTDLSPIARMRTATEIILHRRNEDGEQPRFRTHPVAILEHLIPVPIIM